MKKILLTGGTGYIGSHIAVQAITAGHDVVLYDNFCNSDRKVLAALNEITGKKLSCVEGDIRNTDLLSDTLSKYMVTDVIHLAGLKSVEESVEKPDLYMDNNVEGSRSLIAAMTANGIFKIIFSSSATVYGEPEYLPLDEKHPLSPVNPYADSKLLVEQLLDEITLKNKSWKVINLRYFNPVGSHPSGLIGDNAKAMKANLMPMIARVLSGERDFLEIYGSDYDTQDGTCLRDYIHVSDLAAGHIKAIDYLDKTQGCTAINLGTGDGISVLEMVRAFEKVTGKELPVKLSERRAGDVPISYADCTKAKKVLGWKAEHSVEEMCRSTWDWCQQLGSQ
ncbi:MAG: UDP-glucose 4-epimerase GalE [Gammaproteobacteria bacterium]|nr:UDP-glucose 4-epimerase GalE [Gammaproteobacteria bacterium]